MGRPRAILHLELQPDAQVHPELQLQGDGHKAPIIIIPILLPGHDTVPVERCTPGRLISTRSSVPYNPWGSAQLCRRTSCVGDRGTMGRPLTCGSSRDPVRSLPGSRRVLLRELGLQAGRRPDGFLEPAYARRAGRDPAHLETRRSLGRCSQRRGPIHGLTAHGPYRTAPSDLGPP
jgi:hypothetical protein